MAIEISISNSSFKGKSKVLNNAKLYIKGTEDVVIKLQELQVEDESEILKKLKIEDLMDNMNPSSGEYKALENLTKEKNNKQEFKEKMINHIKEFSQGVLAKTIIELLKE